MRKKILVLILLFLVFSLSAESGNEGAIFLLDKAITKIYPSGKIETIVHQKIKIVGEKGKKFAELQIPYDNERQRVRILKAFTITPDGKTLKVSRKNIKVVTPAHLAEFTPLYPGIRSYTVTFPGAEIGSTIEYKYKIFTFKPLMENHFWDGFYFQSTEPFLHSIYILKIPSGKKFSYREFGVKMKSKEKRGMWEIYTWEKRNVPPLIPEIMMPPFSEVVPKVILSNCKSWEEIGKWFFNLSKDCLEETEEMERCVLKLTEKKNFEEKIKSIYHYICKNIRYVGLEMGIHGYKPHKASEVFKFKYGDCKDKSILMVTMLKIAGIKSYPVLINTRTEIIPEIPSPGQFNHAIVAIPYKDNFLFLDPTSEVFKFPHLPPFDQNRFCLVVKKEKSVFTKTPLFPPDTNLRRRIIKAKIDRNGNLYAEVEVKPEGIYEAGLRSRFRYLKEIEQKRRLERELNRIFPNTELLSFSIKGLGDLSSNLEERYSFRTSNYGIRIRNKIIFCPALIDKISNTEIVALKERKYPLRFGYLRRKEEIIEYKIPENFKIEVLPPKKEINKKFGYYLSEIIPASGNLLKYRRIFEIKAYEIKVDQYKEFKKFYEEISHQDRLPVILTESS